MDPTNRPLTVELGGEQRTMYFDLNTFAAFEEVTRSALHPEGKRFFAFIADMERVFSKVTSKGSPIKELSLGEVLTIVGEVSLTDIRALAWAAMHEYPDTKGPPEWPLTLHEVGRLIDAQNLGTLLPRLLSASSDNMPDAEEIRPSREETVVAPDPPSPPVDGGGGSGPTDQVLLDSLEKTSAG